MAKNTIIINQGQLRWGGAQAQPPSLNTPLIFVSGCPDVYVCVSRWTSQERSRTTDYDKDLRRSNVD